jgi:excisionase family DNA binding protein
MTVRELAAYLNLQPGTIYRLAEKNALPVIRIGEKRRTLRFRREDVLNWLRQADTS